jgi:hypothetical protein
MSSRARARRMLRVLAASIAVFLVCTGWLAWSVDQFQAAWGLHHGGVLVWSTSMWVVDLSWTASVAWDAGSMFLRRSRPRPLPRQTAETCRYLDQRPVYNPHADAERALIEAAAARVVQASGRHAYTPMSKRPDSDLETQVDLSPQEPTQVQPREAWRPPVSDTAAPDDWELAA